MMFHATNQFKTCATLALLSATVVAAPTDSESRIDAVKNPLAGKQSILRDRVGRLEDRMFKLSEVLAETEPENAKKLMIALRKSRELGVAGDMETVIKLLREQELGDAQERQKQVVTKLETLLRLLLEELNDRDELEREMKRLEEMLRDLDEIVKEQKAERADSRAASDMKRARAEMQEAKARLENLIRKQRDQVESTDKAMSGKQPSEGKKLESEQAEVRRDTEKLAKQLEQLPSQEAAENAGEATEAMESAERKLGAEKLPQAKRDQQTALDKLESTIKRLERKIKELEKKPDFDKMQGEQQKTESKTGELAKQMSGSPPKSGEQGEESQQGEQGESRQKPPTPGQAQVKKAQENMKQAAGKLGESKPKEAEPEQDEALEQLEQARRQMEERLRQLREEEKAELLADLEARFRSMLARQREVNKATTALDQKGKADWKRADQLLTGKLSTDEGTLAGDADKALQMLRDDGTSVIFPRVVEQLGDDMRNVATLLAAARVDRLTQEIETDIVRTLEGLVAALEKLQEQNDSSGNSPPSAQNDEDDKSPLLPPSAELKLLRGMQIRVNDRTQAFAEIRGDKPTLEAALAEQLGKITERQDDVADLAREMIERADAP